MAEHKTLSKIAGLPEALRSFGEEPFLNREQFNRALGAHLTGCGLTLTGGAQRKALWQTIGVHDEAADFCRVTTGGRTRVRSSPTRPCGTPRTCRSAGGAVTPKTHEALRETVQAYFDAEVKPHVDDAWIDWTKTKTGYEIPFARHFYTYQPPPAARGDRRRPQPRRGGEILEMLREVEA